MRTLKILVIICLSLIGQAKSQSLFESDDILHLQIKFPVKETISDREVRDQHQGTLYYNDGDTLSVKLMVRGMTRAKPTLCSFPPIRLNFKKKQVKGTIFEGQDKLKLVTHCNPRKINEQYVLREYNTYKLYQIITDYSFRVRLCKISYVDTDGKFNPEEHYGFLIEDIDDVAERNNMERYKGKLLNQDAFHREELDRLVFFQYMIGNLDWSVPKEHNFKLIYGKEIPSPIAVPYDFDFSGMVNTTYAKPPPEIPVATVRERNFRGFCRTPGTYEAVVADFIEMKPEFYKLYSTSEYLSEKSIDQSLKYLDSFYKVLNNEKDLNKKIIEACRINHTHMFDQ